MVSMLHRWEKLRLVCCKIFVPSVNQQRIILKWTWISELTFQTLGKPLKEIKMKYN
jgi:hypothetical protein